MIQNMFLIPSVVLCFPNHRSIQVALEKFQILTQVLPYGQVFCITSSTNKRDGKFQKKKNSSRLVYLTDLMELMAEKKNAIQKQFSKQSRATFNPGPLRAQ